MALRYVDPAAVGANNGTSWADAWTDFQDAVDNWAAGDTIYCRGTQILAAQIDVDGADGIATNPIKIIGMNASGVDDGTYFTLDGNAAVSCYIPFRGIALKLILCWHRRHCFFPLIPENR